ncbi:UvrD-helicase domain-containing protein, partial [Helicobacter pylori]
MGFEKSILGNLNEAQKIAASHIQGPLLILAGAGSGKTKTLTSRLAYLIGV